MSSSDSVFFICLAIVLVAFFLGPCGEGCAMFFSDEYTEYKLEQLKVQQSPCPPVEDAEKEEYND